MTREEAVAAIEVGIQMVKKCAEAGYEILATGEMGIGNTTTSSAVVSVLLGEDPKVMTGKGAGLTKKGLQRRYRSSGKRLSGCSRIKQMRSMYFLRLEDLT